MPRYRVWLSAIVLCMALPLASAAWEFNMDGAFTWEWEIISQTGPNGFFGRYNVDNGAATAVVPFNGGGGSAASLNFWAGQQGGGLVSGSDATRNTQYMSTNMDLRINPAVRIRGLYWIGEWAPVADNPDRGVGNLVLSEYLNQRAPGIQRSFSPGYWNTLWMTAQLPWGTVAFGKRPSIWGMGLGWNGAESRTSESLSLTADYGPFRLAAGVYPSRRAEVERRNGLQLQSEANDDGIAPGNEEGYYNLDFDRNNTRVYDFTFPSITYRNGPLDMGVQFNWVNTHRGGERWVRPVGRTRDLNQRSDQPSREVFENYGGAYVKYFNGRFFFNGEFDWRNIVRRFDGSNNLLPSNRRYQGPTYTEGYRGAIEMGALCGPSKVSVLYSWLGGTDRRGGNSIGVNQGTFSDPVTASGGNLNPLVTSNAFANTGLFRPYSYLMVYNYGTGAFFNADTGNGYADDASIFAARLDYAVASNLNVYSSFMWADRVGNAYGWGYLSPLTPRRLTGETDTLIPPNVFGAYRGNAANPRRTIPDNNLGWEIDAGFDWKILEGFNINATFGYWQPGKWFNYACVDRGVPGWDTLSQVGAGQGTLYWGVNPNRSIDPIWGMEFKLVGEF